MSAGLGTLHEGAEHLAPSRRLLSCLSPLWLGGAPALAWVSPWVRTRNPEAGHRELSKGPSTAVTSGACLVMSGGLTAARPLPGIPL